MQEEIQQKTIALVFKTTRLTSDTLRRAMAKYMAQANQKRRENKAVKQEKKNRSPPVKRGKQTVKALIAQDRGTNTMALGNQSVKSFEQVARKYGVDFAIRKNKSTRPPQYTVFFKSSDKEAIISAFTEYTTKIAKKQERPSVLKLLRSQSKERLAPNKERSKQKERER